MAISADIEEVTTADSAPASAPFKISEQPTKDAVVFVWKVVAGAAIRAWRIRFDPLNRNLGTLIEKQGMVCGSGDRCGEPSARSLAVASPLVRETTVEDSDLPNEADGEYEIKVWAISETDGWST